MQYPIIDTFAQAYINNGWTGINIPATITYTPIQLGSGDPSPDNVRPILPATTLNIGGVDIPIYGGSLDVATGVLTVTEGYVEFDGSDEEEWIRHETGSAGAYCMKIIQPNILRTSTLITTISNYLPGVMGNSTWGNYDYFIAVTTGGLESYIYTGIRNITTLNNWKAYLSSNPLEVVYTLDTPTTVQLTTQELGKALSIDKDILHRLKLPMQHYFPHPVIDALQAAAAGTQTAEQTEVLRHYLTPLGIGGI